MAKRAKTWIVVADGARAKFLINEGAGTGLTPTSAGELTGERRPTRELGTDKPGRTFESADGARHGYAPRADWHEYEKHLFAKRVVAAIEEAHKRDAFEALVLVAPPKALGDLRAALPASLRRQVISELAKDLTPLAHKDLEAQLAGVVRL